MRLKAYINEVYMSKSLKKDIDAARKGSTNKFKITVDGFKQEEAKTIKSANTKRQKWIRWYMRDSNVDRPTAEKAVQVKEI